MKQVALDASGQGTVSCDNATVTAPRPPPLEAAAASQSNLALWTTRAGSPYFAPLHPPVAATNLALGKEASASSALNADSAPGKAIDSRQNTSWSSAPGQTNDQWLQLDFGAPVSFDTVRLQEPEHCQRITSYKIQVWTGAWSDIARGKGVGKAKVNTFPLVLASKVRLFVTTATGSPALGEFEVYQTRTPATEHKGP